MAKKKTTPKKNSSGAKKKSSGAKKKGVIGFSLKNLKTNSLNSTLPTAGGVMAAHLLTKNIPLKNEKIKKAIPLGLGVLAAASNNKAIVSAGAGMFAYGFISTAREFLGLGSTPVSGLSDNETLQKIGNALLPSLGNPQNFAAMYDESDGYNMEPVEDIDFSVTESNMRSNNPWSNGMGTIQSNPWAA